MGTGQEMKYYDNHVMACLELRTGQLIYWNRELKQWYISTPQEEKQRHEKLSQLEEESLKGGNEK